MANIEPTQLENSTPCESWNVAELINHMVGGQRFFAAGLKGEAPAEAQNWAEGDYLAAFDEATAECVECFQQEGVMEQNFTLPFGEMPGSAFMGLAMTDTFQHGWDLAKATGQSTDLAPELAGAILQQSRRNIQESFRGADGQAPFGAEQQCADGSCNADQLAAFLGREA